MPTLSIKPFIAYPYGAAFQMTIFSTVREWSEADTANLLFYPRGTGHPELRVYFKGLHDSDTILDETGTIQQFQGELDQ